MSRVDPIRLRELREVHVSGERLNLAGERDLFDEINALQTENEALISETTELYQAVNARSITALVKRAYENAKSKGWYEVPATVGDRIALMHSELSEALEEYRNGHKTTEVYPGVGGKPEGVPIELADVLIRIFDFSGNEGIDLESAVISKMDYNATRPHRHGGKKL